MKKLFILALVVFTVVLGATANIQAEDRPLNYNNGLYEYYAALGKGVSDEMIEEVAIVSHTEDYSQKRNNDFEWKEVRQVVKKEIEAEIEKIKNAPDHNYNIYTQADLGDYDFDAQGFEIDSLDSPVASKLGAFREDMELKKGAKIAEGVIHHKVNDIMLIFTGNKGANFLKYPEEQAKELLKKRTEDFGVVNKTVNVIVRVEIVRLKDPKEKKKYEKMRDSIYMPGYSGKYMLVAKIKGMEAYEDAEYKNKLGDMTVQKKGSHEKEKS